MQKEKQAVKKYDKYISQQKKQQLAYYSEVRLTGEAPHKSTLVSKEDERLEFYEYKLVCTYSVKW